VETKEKTKAGGNQTGRRTPRATVAIGADKGEKVWLASIKAGFMRGMFPLDIRPTVTRGTQNLEKKKQNGDEKRS